jgi:hypothetical protein
MAAFDAPHIDPALGESIRFRGYPPEYGALSESPENDPGNDSGSETG